MGEPALNTDEISWVITPPIEGGKTPPAATILENIFTVRNKNTRSNLVRNRGTGRREEKERSPCPSPGFTASVNFVYSHPSLSNGRFGCYGAGAGCCWETLSLSPLFFTACAAAGGLLSYPTISKLDTINVHH